MKHPYFKRLHHYIFAYYALRENVERHPAKVVQALMRDDTLFLLRLWKLAGKIAVEKNEAKFLLPTGLDRSIHKLASSKTLVVVTLPIPAYGTEAYYIGFVTQVTGLKSKKPESLIKPRYFAYELMKSPGQALGQKPKFAFCEWGEKGSRINRGAYHETSQEAFVGLVLNVIGDKLE